jgi:hypothetical protein
MSDVLWNTVDRLIHDLGAIRAFIDEAEAVPEVCGAPEVADVKGAMNAATDAISSVLRGGEGPAVEVAWTAIARAQDTVGRARALIVQARASADAADRMREINRAQVERVREQRQRIADHGERVRTRTNDRLRPLGDGEDPSV